jgi:hypothetical protein
METTQQASEPPIKAPYFGEPWKATAVSRIEDRDGYWQADTRNNDQRDRIITCVNACVGMADPATDIRHLTLALELANEEAATRIEELERLERENAAMRDAIREAHTQIRFAESSFAGMALRLHPNDPSNDAILTRTGDALAKLQPFLPKP